MACARGSTAAHLPDTDCTRRAQVPRCRSPEKAEEVGEGRKIVVGMSRPLKANEDVVLQEAPPVQDSSCCEGGRTQLPLMGNCATTVVGCKQLPLMANRSIRVVVQLPRMGNSASDMTPEDPTELLGVSNG